MCHIAPLPPTEHTSPSAPHGGARAPSLDGSGVQGDDGEVAPASLDRSRLSSTSPRPRIVLRLSILLWLFRRIAPGARHRDPARVQLGVVPVRARIRCPRSPPGHPLRRGSRASRGGGARADVTYVAAVCVGRGAPTHGSGVRVRPPSSPAREEPPTAPVPAPSGRLAADPLYPSVSSVVELPGAGGRTPRLNDLASGSSARKSSWAGKHSLAHERTSEHRR
jgi:hypothetical protein